MNVPGLGNLDVSDWLRGLIGAFIGGAAGAFGTAGSAVTSIDPAYIGSHGTGFIFTMMWKTAIFSGVIGAALFLKQKSLPDPIKTTEVTLEKTTVGAKPPVVVETVKETTVSTEPPKP